MKVINMNERRAKRKTTKNTFDMLDWMLAIDFDPVEIRLTRNSVFQKYVHALDASAFRIRRGD
jgi:hypothetical protein